MFFKVSSVGAKRIDVMRKAFPSVPWIFVYRDPVQTIMSHLDPAKIAMKKNVRGGFPPAVCLRAQKHPPEDLVQLVSDYGEDVDELSPEEFCAAHLVRVQLEFGLCKSLYDWLFPLTFAVTRLLKGYSMRKCVETNEEV